MEESVFLPLLALHSYPRLTPKARLQPDRVTGELALLYPEGVLMLNPTGAAILELCDGQHTILEVATTLAEQYGVTPEEITPDVIEYLDRLHVKRLIELHNEANS